MPAFEWVHVQLHQQKGMISLSPPTICNSAIDCTWTANNEVAVDSSGKEFTTNLIFFTELKRNGVDATMPKRDWYIARGDTTSQFDPLKAGANVIKAVTEWDMSFFEEEPDYKVMT
ncbi:hypothetical protein IV910_002015 [Salmonella enterica subsp. enterica serovar Infantis]|uniref:Uncharacterized protein n=2 Tax=Salmonella TaxID=590 RepID=A0A6Y3IKY6_SALIN|nr:hypothetical protein [Salmonella enterica subsp. enterica serovar Infantis]EGP3028047.1 hypothetical protein [Salmonella enterica subsp. enterica serovar Infantis]EGP3082821.1 hypothetical protein [Salmonella enterica subsp. enterica serovar Infantis]HAB5029998.1 hypothetical protein [Salmonella enterica subsp. enterica serovar Infantis]